MVVLVDRDPLQNVFLQLVAVFFYLYFSVWR
nr:MAG TPA: hypothetical protein [Caudoviricetes sp.]